MTNQPLVSPGQLTPLVIEVEAPGPQGSAGIAAADAPLYYDPERLAVGVNIGTTSGTVAAGNDSRFASLLARLDAFRDARRIYVSPSGSDANNGRSLGEPLKTLGAAAAVAQPGDVVEIGPGTYVETLLPIRWKRDVSLLCRGMRNAVVRPAAGQEFNDIFHVDSGFWCWGLQFAGHQSDQANGIQSWAISFDALADNRSIGAIGLGAFILKSPYIQNCTSITAEDDAGVAGSQSVGDTGGGLLVDGSRCAINSPIRSMVVDSYTQVNLGGPGCLVRNDGYAQLVSFFGTFCQYHVRSESGGQVNLSGGGTSDFGTYGLMADGYSPSPVFVGKARVATFGAARIERAVAIDPATDLFTATAHGLAAGDQITFKVSNGTLPAPLTTNTIYFVLASGLSNDAFKISATAGGAAVNITGSASGAYQLVRQGATTVDVIDCSANRLGRQIQYPSAGSPGSPGNPVTIASVSGAQFTVTLNPVAGILHTYTGGGKVTVSGVDYPVTSATYNNNTGVTTLTATGFTPTQGQNVVLSGLSFACNSASRPTAGQLMFPQLVFPRDASTGAAQAKTFSFTRTGTYTLTYPEAAAPAGPDHEYVSGGSAVVGGTDLGVRNAVYNKTTGVVTLTTKTAVPSASGSITVSNLAFICPTSAYVISSSVPIDASGVEVASNAPTKAGYRVSFFNNINGGLINRLDAGQILDFRQRSQITAPGHTFEYVGSGTNYDALPINGGVPVPGNKIVETNNGRIYSSNTDELGNFTVGTQFSVDGTTGAVTINTDQFNLSGLNFIGPFSRNGGFSTVGVQLQEVSNNSSLIASTGAPDANTVPTQFAVQQFTGSRYVSGVSTTAGQPISVTGAAQADPNGNWTYVPNINLSLNEANGLARLDGSTLIPRALLPAATTSSQGALSGADKTKIDSLGSAAYTDTTAYATAAQGSKADSAVQPAALTTALAGKADLIGGKVPSSQIPSIAITDYLGAVANQAAMLALTGQRGDWCIRTDRSRAWVLSGDDASVLGNWVELVTPADAVSSVNGQTGVVVLGASDVGAATAAQGAKADTAVQPGSLATVATTGAYSDLSGKPSLGTAAAQNVGTSAGNVIQLNGSGKLPAVDGSLLTNLPAGATNLDALTDVVLTSPTNGQTLRYDSVAGAWINDTVVSATDLSYTASTRLLASSTGADVTLPEATTSDAGLMSAGDKTKLNGIATGATANATDAQLRDRSTHTGTQAGSTVTGAYTAAGLTMATARLLGRGTAGTGAAEEITLGTNLSLSGTTLNAAGGSPGGSSGQLQFNDGGSFGGDVDLTYDKTTNLLTTKGDISLDDGGSFTTTLQTITPTANRTISLPDATGTVALVAGSSGQILYNNAGALGGTTSTWDSTNGTRYILPFGYGSGAGGTVTQATNKSTGVTLNARCGQITMNAANLATNTAVTFTLTNSQIAETDILMLNHVSGGTLGTYSFVARCAAGSATIAVRNVTGGDLAEAVVIAFAVIKATTS